MPLNKTILENATKNNVLELSRMNIQDKDVQGICDFLKNNPGIHTLNVSSNSIGDEGAKALAGNTTITTLNVGFNTIGEEGAKALAGNTTITTLNVGFNTIGEEGAKALADNTTITTLDVGGNKIGDELTQKIHTQVLRNCEARRIKNAMRFGLCQKNTGADDEKKEPKNTFNIHFNFE